MKFYLYLREDNNIDESFLKLEDPKISKRFDYSSLTLKKAPKELEYVIKMLKKHLKTPLNSITYKNGTKGDGGMNLAIYSESLDGMGINITNIKKLKTGSIVKVNYHDQLKSNQESLVKWEVFQKKAVSPKDKKKARGAINRLSSSIRNLEDKIRKGETPVPFSSSAYAKSKEDAIESVVLHELGHRERHKHDMFKIQVYYNNGEFPSEYSKRNISEYFSEIYALVKMRIIDKTPISDEAKREFKKIIK